MMTKNVKLGVYSGLAGGVVFGAMMGMMGMLPMIGKMAALEEAGGGTLFHLKQGVLAAVRSHTGGSLGHDDVTLIAVDVH